jgi:hypothetical protein
MIVVSASRMISLFVLGPSIDGGRRVFSCERISGVNKSFLIGASLPVPSQLDAAGNWRLACSVVSRSTSRMLLDASSGRPGCVLRTPNTIVSQPFWRYSEPRNATTC